MSVELAPDGLKCAMPGCNPPCRGQAVVLATGKGRYFDAFFGTFIQTDLGAEPRPLCVAHADFVEEARAFLAARDG